MDAAIVTVGNELLAGDVENTNATWLAARLAERGVSVRRIVVLPDEVDTVSDHLRRYADAFDAVVVTGGLGGTPDDLTIEAVAAAFDRPLVPDPVAREAVEERLAEIRERRPDIGVDVEAEASLPAGCRPLPNRAGLSPGCVVENVYVLPGIPDEMEAMFAQVAPELDGDRHALTLHTTTAESDLVGLLEAVRDEFDVAVGCYPDREAGRNRLSVTADDEDAVRRAYEHLRERLAADDALADGP